MYCIISYSDYCTSWFEEVIKDKDIVMIEDFYHTERNFMRFHRFLSRVEAHFNIFGLPGQLKQRIEEYALFRKLRSCGLDQDCEVIFLFFELSFACFSYQLQRKLKQRFSNSKNCFMFTNVDKGIRTVENKLKLFKSEYCAIMTYDANMANKYGFVHLNIPYSTVGFNNDISLYTSDVFFCGVDKGRTEKLIEIFNHLRAKSLRCVFWIRGDCPPDFDESQADGLIFIHNKIDYCVIRKAIMHTRCILEVINNQDATYAESYTVRVQEAIAYEKKLISNCHGITDKSFYNINQFLIFDAVDDIHTEFVLNESTQGYTERNYFSPRKFLTQIDMILAKNDAT